MKSAAWSGRRLGVRATSLDREMGRWARPHAAVVGLRGWATRLREAVMKLHTSTSRLLRREPAQAAAVLSHLRCVRCSRAASRRCLTWHVARPVRGASRRSPGMLRTYVRGTTSCDRLPVMACSPMRSMHLGLWGSGATERRAWREGGRMPPPSPPSRGHVRLELGHGLKWCSCR